MSLNKGARINDAVCSDIWLIDSFQQHLASYRTDIQIKN